MKNKRIGKRTVKLENKPTIISTGTIVGPKEGEGPLKDYFDMIMTDDLYGEKTWELAESKMVETASQQAIQKAGKKLSDVNYMLGGDLINQIVPASFGKKRTGYSIFRYIWSLFYNGRRSLYRFYAYRWWFC